MRMETVKYISMRGFATTTLLVLAVGIMAFYLPMLYGKLFFDKVDKTNVLYSPLAKRFVYTEKIVGPLPPETLETGTDHNPVYSYRDQSGGWYTRVQFEKLLPFIYYKNWELWGLLPVKINGRSFDKEGIKENRRVLELKSREIADASPQESVWPLLESEPGQVRLVFPKDRFRITATRMEFVNADVNRIDEKTTTLFTEALKESGFVFPVRSINGKHTVFKPFDEGVFLVDTNSNVFHVKRRHGLPEVVRTPIDPRLKTRHIKLAESKQKRYYGLLLDEEGALHLITYENYRLISLPLDGYAPDSMDVRLIFNPLYCTAVYSDNKTVRAVVMDKEFRLLDSWQHRMSRATPSTARKVYEAVFPFRIDSHGWRNRSFVSFSLARGGLFSLVGIGTSLLMILLIRYGRYGQLPGKRELFVVAFTGVYGLIALNFLRLKD